MDRRRFLELLSRRTLGVAGLAYSAPWLVSCASSDDSPNAPAGDDDDVEPPDDERPILVIGAGVAGLSAAKALTLAGHDVVVLEARDRIGGRTHTVDIGGGQVDVGGAWIHGPIGNPLAAYCSATGLSFALQDLDPDAFYDAIHAAELGEAEVNTIFGYVEDFESAVYSLPAATDPNGSVADGIAQYLAGQTLDPTLRKRLEFALEVMFSAYSAPLSELSLPAILTNSGDGTGGGDAVLNGGYTELVDSLADGLDVRLRVPVAEVRRFDDRVELVTSAGVEVGSHAIVTVPLGVLKAGGIAFDPVLPAGKQQAIARIGFGSFEKVILTFSERFWQGSFTNLLRCAGTAADRSFPAFFDMTDFAGVPTLVALLDGAFAANALDTNSDPQLVEAATSALEQVLGTSPPAPTATNVTRWRSDPFALGSYSFAAVGAMATDFAALAAPVAGRVLFAGEATTWASTATVHGALVTGLREARRIDSASALPGI